MSKSYRYNPEDEEVSNVPSWERPDEAFSVGEMWPGEEASARPRRRKTVRTADPHAPATPEEAIDLMKDRVDTILSTLVQRGLFPPHEKEDYAQILNIHICRTLPLYDPGRTGWNNRAASLRRYLNVVVDSAVANIVKHCRTRKVTAMAAMPLPDEDGGDECDDTGRPCGGNPYRNHRRYMEGLWLRMDLEVLSRMLTDEERIALEMRLRDFTYPEIADETNARLHLGVDRFHVMNVTMEGVRRAARRCGFSPRGRNSENSSHFAPCGSCIC